MNAQFVIKAIADLLTEAYAGPPDPSGTWFIDNERDSGILGILQTVSAAEASQPVHASGEAGSTIASHAEHLRWSLAQSNAAMRGEGFSEKWAESWQLLDADQAGWDQLRSSLRTEFETLLQTVQSQADIPEDDITGVLALIPHAAYHLGNIRQMVERVRQA